MGKLVNPSVWHEGDPQFVTGWKQKDLSVILMCHPVYATRVDPSDLAFSLSSHRNSHISLLFDRNSHISLLISLLIPTVTCNHPWVLFVLDTFRRKRQNEGCRCACDSEECEHGVGAGVNVTMLSVCFSQEQANYFTSGWMDGFSENDFKGHSDYVDDMNTNFNICMDSSCEKEQNP